MPTFLTPQQFLTTGAEVLVDVRSPGEFGQGHWPGAQNLPLFSDEERAEVGTLYKQTSPDAALLRGLEIAGSKMRWYVEESRRLASNQILTIHCWRGGQRSQSVAWLLEKAGAQVQVIEGGYKALRQAGRKHLTEDERPWIVLHGPTGSGKTKLMHQLRDQGAAILDLEGMARHKGSAFGDLGEAEQPTTEHFENLLLRAYAQLPPEQPVWVENESKTIGTVYLPQVLQDRMQLAKLVQLDMPLTWRVEQLVADYAKFPIADLHQAFEKIRKRLGGQYVQQAQRALAAGNFAEAATIGLQYYDKAYRFSLERRTIPPAFQLQPETNDFRVITRQLLAWQRKTFPQ